MAVRLVPAQIQAMLHDTVEEMEHNIGQFVNSPGRDFTRHRICTFQHTIFAIMTMESHSLNRELYEYFHPLVAKPPTKSAFIQSRKKLNSEAFPYLLKYFNSKIPFRKTYYGFHLLACDGTDSNIPADASDTRSFIPFNSNEGGYYQEHTVTTFDLMEKRYVDAVIQPRREMKEVDACCEMVDRNPIHGKCLFIADRGFLSFNLLAHIKESDHFFLIRVKDIEQASSPFKYFDLSGKNTGEVQCDFIITRKKGALAQKHPEKYKFLAKSRRFDFIDPEDKHTTYPLSLRLVKITLPGGSPEYLVTNLPEKSFSISKIEHLYQMRWGIETSYLFLKYGIAMNYFHSIDRNSIHQEIIAKLVLYNFISLIVSCVNLPSQSTKYRYQISFSDAIYKCRKYLLSPMDDAVLIELLVKDLTPIREFRSSPRNMRSQCLKSLQNRT